MRETVGGGYIGVGVKAIDVLVRRGLRNQDFCLLATKDGIVLIRERSRDEIHPGAFGYASVHIREHDHSSLENMDSAAEGVRSLVIPYDRFMKIHFRRGFSISTMRKEYILDLEYLDESKKERKISLVLTPSPGPNARISGNRLSRIALTEYAIEVKRILAEALPVSGIFVADI